MSSKKTVLPMGMVKVEFMLSEQGRKSWFEVEILSRKKTYSIIKKKKEKQCPTLK